MSVAASSVFFPAPDLVPLALLGTLPCRAVNRLAGETSPYLLQHADNPVDWYPWGAGGARAGARRGQADLPLGRLLGLPLVPRDGARVVRRARRRRR